MSSYLKAKILEVALKADNKVYKLLEIFLILLSNSTVLL